ncbi:hypothetical protein ZWY2020_054737 [Hordeum vulgare]|nr:hypothetical protein ZWY2020_054737 [Hordeum vulgare]
MPAIAPTLFRISATSDHPSRRTPIWLATASGYHSSTRCAAMAISEPCPPRRHSRFGCCRASCFGWYAHIRYKSDLQMKEETSALHAETRIKDNQVHCMPLIPL